MDRLKGKFHWDVSLLLLPDACCLLRAHFRQPWRSFAALGRLAFRERFDFPLPDFALQDDDLVGIAEAFASFVHLALSHLDDVVLNAVDVRFVLTRPVILDIRA